MLLIVIRSQENKIINVRNIFIQYIVNRFKIPMCIKYHKEIKLYFEIKIESFHENTDNNVDIYIIIRDTCTKFVII
jgi:hypothetical protein